jgi:hypothetical protein
VSGVPRPAAEKKEWSEEEQLKLEQALQKVPRGAIDGLAPVFELFPHRSKEDVMIWVKIIMAEMAAKEALPPTEVRACATHILLLRGLLSFSRCALFDCACMCCMCCWFCWRTIFKREWIDSSTCVDTRPLILHCTTTHTHTSARAHTHTHTHTHTLAVD